MNAVSKKIISIGLIGFISIHFFLIFFHEFPAKIDNTKFRFLTKAYVSTFFHQNWNVFVPAPNYQHYLLVRHKKAGNWVKWQDILGICVENNRHYKFNGNETITLLFSNSLIYELNSVSTQSAFFNKAPSNPEFKVLEHEVSNYLRYREQAQPGDQYEIIIFSQEKNLKRTLYFKSLTVD